MLSSHSRAAKCVIKLNTEQLPFLCITVGCWKDASDRAMVGVWERLGNLATVEKCIELCIAAGILKVVLLAWCEE